MLFEHQYQFSKRMQMHDITEIVKQDIDHCHIDEGIVVVYTPHTTAGITVNENADPDVNRFFTYVSITERRGSKRLFADALFR